MPISPAEFAFMRDFVRERSAIVLEPGKEYLVESRLLPVARQEGLGTVAELVATLRRPGPANGLQRRVVEAMTTNETTFFRDTHPFEALRTEILPAVLRERAAERRITIWSAACSSGQEAYSIAITLREHFPQLAGWQVQVLCTDLSADMVRRCQAGRFSQLEVNRGLPAPLLIKYFKKDGLEWVAAPELRAMVSAREMNLATAWPVLPAVDILFLRNVLIYFDVPTKRQILGRARAALRPGGWLFLGGAETTLNLDDAYERVTFGRAVAYRTPRGRSA